MARIRNIKELAALANVSTGTVSRALAGSDLISKATRERIQAIADDHGFHPNIMARNLRTQRTGAIGVLVPRGSPQDAGLFDQFFIFLLGMVATEIVGRGYDMLLSPVDEKNEDWLDRMVGSGRADGFIVLAHTSQLPTLDHVAKSRCPLVVWGDHVAGQAHSSVGSNDRQGGYLAAQHLVARGCKRLAFFGDVTLPEMRARYDGCVAALADAGMADTIMLVPTQFSALAALEDARGFLQSGSDMPDGIVTATDVVARSVLIALADHGLDVPGDVKIVSYGGLPMTEFTTPRLTTVSQQMERGAALLVDLLLRRISGEDAASVIMEPELIVRASS